jgi:hypothetical protein
MREIKRFVSSFRFKDRVTRSTLHPLVDECHGRLGGLLLLCPLLFIQVVSPHGVSAKGKDPFHQILV